MTSSDISSIDRVITLERRLLQPTARASSQELTALLDADFREVGASGRVWDRAAIIENLTSESGTTPILDEEMQGTLLAEGAVLLTYVSDAGGRRAHRSSIWRRHAGDVWRLLHHQGTLTG